MALKEALTEVDSLCEMLVFKDSLKELETLADFSALKDVLVEADSLCETLVFKDSLKDALAEADSLCETLVFKDSLKELEMLSDFTALKDVLVEAD